MPEPVTEATPKKKRRRSWRKPLRVFLFLLLVFAVFRFVVHQRVVNRLSAIRDAGYPVTMAELDLWIPEPTDTNAADVYQKAFEAFPTDADTEGVPIVSTIEGYIWGQPLSETMAKRSEAYLTKHAEAIRLIEEATNTSECKYPVKWRDGLDAILPHLGKTRHSARLLKLQSILDAHRGDYDRAIDRCICTFGLARSLDQEPLLISSLVSISISRLAQDQIEYLIQSGSISDERLRMISDHSVKPEEVQTMIHRALVGECAAGNLRFQGNGGSQQTWNEIPTDRKVWMYVRRWIGIEDLDHAYWLSCWPITIGYAANPTWPPHDKSWYPDPPPDFYTESHCQCDTFEASTFTTMWIFKAKSRLLDAGVAAERYRLRHGKLPMQLDDLVPEFLDTVPIDPFDNQPLRYRVEDGGVIIYSIGSDERDDGGRQHGEYGEQFKVGTDLAFTFGDLQNKLWPIKELPADAGYGGMGMREYAESIETDETREDNSEVTQP